MRRLAALLLLVSGVAAAQAQAPMVLIPPGAGGPETPAPATPAAPAAPAPQQSAPPAAVVVPLPPGRPA
nr:AraC family transcriptional regulator [Bauldia sp.]